MNLFAEEIRVESGLLADANGGAESARVHLQKSNAVAIVVELAAGTGTTFSMTLRQHDAASGGNSADLISSVPVYHKAAADNKFTRLDVSAATNAISSLDTSAGTVIVQVYQDDLADDYEYISLVLADPGAARIVSVDYMLDTKNKPAYAIEL